MKISYLIAYGMTILLIIIVMNRDVQIVAMVVELMKVLISGYLLYLVRQIDS